MSEENDEEPDDTDEEEKEDAENTKDEEQEDVEEEDAEEEEQKVQEQTFKSNMVTIVKLLQHIKLRNEHINDLKNPLFWALFDVILQYKLNYKQCRKYDDFAL